MNLAKGCKALREFITLDPVALASFCESTSLTQNFVKALISAFSKNFVFSPLSIFLSIGPLSEPADDQRSDQPLPFL